MLDILTFTSLYPNPQNTRNGIFVEHRVYQLLRSQQVRIRVVAPVPWFPFKSPIFGRYARVARIPFTDKRKGINVWHPSYLTVPKVGMTAAPVLMAYSLRAFLKRFFRTTGKPDVLDAHYFYPDGVAAALVGRWFDIPVVVTARGSDINVIGANYRLPRMMIRRAAERCSAVVAVSDALKRRLTELGVDSQSITVLRNGVDLGYFVPRSNGALGNPERDDVRLLSVGNLIPSKGHQHVISALKQLQGATLSIAGDGPMESALRGLASRLGVADRVKFLGTLDQTDLQLHYQGAHLLVLASTREGMPNVILEALACGTPVVATRVGGIPEVVDTAAAGRLIEQASPEAIAEAVKSMIAAYPDREAVRRQAERFSWAPTTEGQLRLFERLSRTRGKKHRRIQHK